ncbi:MAG: vitamin K epoxide reductase family protein, partial [Phycisphaerae bacterium]
MTQPLQTPQTRFQRAVNVVAVLLCGVAVIICHQLVNQHVSGGDGPAWFQAGCSPDQPDSGCGKVLKSRYSYIPPAPVTSEGQQRRPTGLPAAFVGLVYYALLGIWLVGIGTPSADRRHLYLMPCTFMLCGLAASGFYIYVMASALGEWCTWCLTTHMINISLAVTLFLLRPGRTSSPDEPADAGTRVAHPTTRTAMATLVAAILLVYGSLNQLGFKNTLEGAKRINRNYTLCVDTLKTLQDDAETLMRNYDKTPVTAIPTSDNPTARQPEQAGNAWEVVIFSD